jgi:hypothetical protein
VAKERFLAGAYEEIIPACQQEIDGHLPNALRAQAGKQSLPMLVEHLSIPAKSRNLSKGKTTIPGLRVLNAQLILFLNTFIYLQNMLIKPF